MSRILYCEATTRLLGSAICVLNQESSSSCENYEFHFGSSSDNYEPPTSKSETNSSKSSTPPNIIDTIH